MSSHQQVESPWSQRIGQLIDWFPLMAITSLSFVAFFVYILLRGQIIPAVYKELENIADMKEEQLGNWFDQQQKTVLETAQVLGKSPQIKEIWKSGAVDDQQAQTIKKLLKEVGVLENSHSVALLNQSSIIIYATDPSRVGAYQPIQNASTYLTPDNSGDVIPNFYASPDGTPMITFATPLRNEEGQRVGFLAVGLDLDALDQKIRRLPYVLELSSGDTPSLETYLVGRISPEKNQFVSHSLPSDTLAEGISSFGINQAILRRDSDQALYLNYDRTPVIGDYRWFSEYNLALLSELEQHQIFSPARKPVAWIYGLGFSVTGLSSIILFIIKPKLKAIINN